MTLNKDNVYWQICQDDEMGDIIVLVTPIKFDFKGVTYEVPAGFASDGMSVPKAFWSTISPKVNFKTLVPSVVHDYLYSEHLGTRKEADLWYREALIANGFSKIKSYLVYAGVRMFGSSHW